MNTTYLQYALEIEKTSSISRAAEKLFISQPQLSKALKELEEDVGYMIFKRGPKGVQPTEQGRSFLNSARIITTELSGMKEAGKTVPKTEHKLKVAIPRSSYLSEGFVRLLKELDTSSGLNGSIMELHSQAIINHVANGTCHLGVIRYAPRFESYFMDALRERKLSFCDFWEADMLLLFSKDHPLADVREIRQDDLKPWIELMHGDSYVPYYSSNESLEQKEHHGWRRRVFVFDRANQLELLSRIHGAYMWVSPMPQPLIDRYELIQRPCAGRRFKDVIIYPRNHELTSLERELIRKWSIIKKELTASVEKLE